jgi:hypothetical protein
MFYFYFKLHKNNELLNSDEIFFAFCFFFFSSSSLKVISILSLPGDKKFRISDQGAAEITVDSGLALYQYLLPAKTK